VYAVRQTGLVFTPFKVAVDQSDTPQTIFKLIFDCSPLFAAKIQLGSIANNICNSSAIQGTASDINLAITKIPITTNSTANATVSISFALLDAIGKQLSTQTINFVTLKSIPLTYQVFNLQIEHKTKMANVTSSFLVGTIDSTYCKFFGTTGLSFTTTPSLPNLSIRLTECQINVTVLDVTKIFPTSLGLTITDGVSGLNAAWNLTIMPPIGSNGNSASLTRADFWIFVVISLIIIACFFLMLYYANNKAEQYEKTKAENANVRYPHPDDLRNQTIEINPNVLSDSIITWNKQLMAKYQQKNLITTNTFEKNTEKILKKPALSPKEDTALVQMDIKDDKHVRPFEDISEIGTVDFHKSMNMEPYRKDDSFFDD